METRGVKSIRHSLGKEGSFLLATDGVKPGLASLKR